MKFTKGIIGLLALVVTGAFASALSAQTLKVLTAGSSAQFGPFAEAAWALATSGGVTAYHYTVKSGSTCPTPAAVAAGTASWGSCYVFLNDSRSTSIPYEPGNLWVVWSSNGIWAYLSVDSTVGVRAFQATPRATLGFSSSSAAPTAQSAYNSYFDGNADTALTSTVFSALYGIQLTAANTDIRPEDALFATNRTLNTLKYATSAGSLIGNAIESAFGTSPAVAHPVSFALSGGTDPFSSETVPTILTLPIGAAPVIFLASASTSSSNVTASATNITTAHAGELFSGTNCDSSLLGLTSGTALNPILREPLSGTMNTVQYSVFWPSYDQENSINAGYATPSATSGGVNPLNLPCTSGNGYRYRAVGTGDEVKAVQGAQTVSTGLHGASSVVANAVGYAFFSYESTTPSSTYPYHYLSLDGVDPLYSSYSTSGALPSCAKNSSGVYDCPVAGGSSFPNLRNGTYSAWSVYRLITDSTNLANAQTLVEEADALVDNYVPDFVPIIPVCASGITEGTDEPGLAVYREHYVPSTITTTPSTISITANDGPVALTSIAYSASATSVSCIDDNDSTYKLPSLTLGGADPAGSNNEAGGDVGGTIVVNSTGAALTPPGSIQTSNH